MANTLVLFTADFPFGSGETFLETEIEFLSKGFKTIRIISANTQQEQTRVVPNNCSVERINLNLTTLQKIQSLLGIFSEMYRSEKGLLNEKYGLKLNAGIRKTMLVSLFRAKLVAEKAESILQSVDKEDQLFFYSYWSDDVAIGLGMLQNKHPKIRTFSRIHRWDVYFEESAFGYLPYRSFLVNSISKIVSISQDGMDYVNRTWKTEQPEKLVLSRLGVGNHVPFRLAENERFTLVSCSNLIPVKRVDLLAQALVEISDLPLKWIHFGDGVERQKIEKTLENRSEKLLVEFKGRVPNNEIYSYYAEHKPDLFINVSSSEGVPVSIMEAMSFGIPVIATDAGGNNEIVTNENGELLPLGLSVSELAEKIKQFFELDQGQKVTVQEKSLEMWRDRYNSETNYSSFVDFIIQLQR
jgi:colanic acid/amylovoran biosynthesis glycosyltransferase